MSKINYDEISEASCGKKNGNTSEATCDKQNGNTSAVSGNAQYDNSTSSKIMKKEDPVASTSGQYKCPYSVSTRSKMKKYISLKTHYSREVDRQSDNSLQHQATSAAMPDNTKSMSGELSESQELGNQSSSLSQEEINMIKFETFNQPPDYSQEVVVVFEASNQPPDYSQEVVVVSEAYNQPPDYSQEVVVVSEASNQPPDYSQEVVVVSKASNQPSNKLPDKLPNQPLVIKDIKYQSHPANLFLYFSVALSVSALDENRRYALQLKTKSLEDIREIHNKMKDQTDLTVRASCLDHKDYHQSLIKRIDDREKEIRWWAGMHPPKRNGLIFRIFIDHFPDTVKKQPDMAKNIIAILRIKESGLFLNCTSEKEYITNLIQWARVIETDIRMQARNNERRN